MAYANYLWAANRRDEAERELMAALALEPGNLLAHRALVAFYMASGRAPEAEPHMKALAESDKTASAPLKLALADYYLAINRTDDGMKVLEEVSQGKQAFAAAATRMAAVEYVKKGAAEGNRRIDEVLAKDPKNVPALIVKTRFLLSEKKLDAALQESKAAVDADPTSIQAHFLRGMIFRARGEPDQAIASFNEVLKLNPQAVAAQLQLSELNLSKGARGPALQLAQDAAKQLPKDPVVQLTLIRSLVANGQGVQADVVARDLVARYPNAVEVQAAVGTVALAKRDLPGARKAFARAAEIDASNLDAAAGLITLDFADKKPEAARARVDALLARSPSDGRALVLGARVYATLGDKARAEQLLRKVIDVDPGNLQAFGMLSQLYASEKRLPEARASLEEIVKKRPDAIGPQTLIGMLYEAEGNRPEAKKRYERVLQIDPSAAVAANNLAYIYAADGGNLDLALQMAQTAKQKLPELAEVSDTVGWIYLKKGMPALAIPMLEEATGKAPANAEMQFHLAQAYLQSGQKIKAKQVFDKLSTLNPDPKLADQIQKAKAEL